MTTKREVAAFIKQHGCTAHYSGNTRTMFITGWLGKDVELDLRRKLEGKALPFRLASQAEQMVYPKPVNKFAKPKTPRS